jgi:GT2 family glycosyltransferase
MFSVVIPLFNKGPYVQRAFDSIYAQSFPPTEIIVVNDGSSDGGEQIAKSQTDPRVKVIDQPNRGVCAARNVAIAAATQPFIAFLDADDQWRPGFLATMRSLITAHPGAALYGAGYVTFANGKRTGEFGLQGEAGPVDFFKEWSRGHLLHTSTTVVPKVAAEAVGGFGEHVAYGDDYHFWAKLAMSGPVVLSPEWLSEYNMSVPGQIIEYYRTEHTRRFEVFEYERFLADALRRGMAEGHIDRSLAAFCRKDFGLGMLQRLYWGNFVAMEIFRDTLGLNSLPLGCMVSICCWVSRNRLAQLLLAPIMAGARSIRGFFKKTQWR